MRVSKKVVRHFCNKCVELFEKGYFEWCLDLSFNDERLEVKAKNGRTYIEISSLQDIMSRAEYKGVNFDKLDLDSYDTYLQKLLWGFVWYEQSYTDFNSLFPDIFKDFKYLLKQVLASCPWIIFHTWEDDTLRIVDLDKEEFTLDKYGFKSNLSKLSTLQRFLMLEGNWTDEDLDQWTQYVCYGELKYVR